MTSKVSTAAGPVYAVACLF